MHRHVIIEGSSSAKNYHDESGKHGFTGRIDDRLREDFFALKSNSKTGSIPYWTYVDNYARPARYMPAWARRFGGHLSEALSRYEFTEKGVRSLGIFVLEGHPLFLLNKYGGSATPESDLKNTWRDALEVIQEECMVRDVTPMFVQMPAPLRQIGRIGLQVHNDLLEITHRAAYSMDDAPVLHVTDMLGGHSPEPFIAGDRMHPRGPGHELIYRHLMPMVYEKLDLEPQTPLPEASPEAVLRDFNYTTAAAELAIRHA